MVINTAKSNGAPDSTNSKSAEGPQSNPIVPQELPPAPIPTIVEKMPKFNGDLQEYFSAETKYPDFEKSEHIGGTVYVTFVVEKDGTISNIRLLHGIAGADLNNEALPVVAAMPPWIPGEQGGHKVKVQCNLPVKFSVN